MRQKQIRTVGHALAQATLAIGGATTHEATIGLKQNTADSIAFDRDALVTARNVYDEAKAELDKRRTAFKMFVPELITFVTLARDVLKPKLGRKHSTYWSPVGFIRSLEIPREVSPLKNLVQMMGSYFAANPMHQNSEADITSVKAKELYEELCARENALNSQRTTVGELLAVRNEKLRALCKRLSGVANELRQLVPADDARFLSFGLRSPGSRSTPGVPTNVVAVKIRSDAFLVRWDRPPRAEHYRAYLKVKGVHTEPVAVGSRVDPDFTFEDLPVDSEMEFSISAVNRAGESAHNTISVATGG